MEDLEFEEVQNDRVRLNKEKLKTINPKVISSEEALKDAIPYLEEEFDVKESFIESIKEMQLMREGKLPKRNWRDSFAKLKEENELEEEKYVETKCK